jgi:hypothetical protein
MLSRSVRKKRKEKKRNEKWEFLLQCTCGYCVPEVEYEYGQAHFERDGVGVFQVGER